jgi:hypothetical protein
MGKKGGTRIGREGGIVAAIGGHAGHRGDGAAGRGIPPPPLG